jgi:hypothetical protein
MELVARDIIVSFMTTKSSNAQLFKNLCYFIVVNPVGT